MEGKVKNLKQSIDTKEVALKSRNITENVFRNKKVLAGLILLVVFIVLTTLVYVLFVDKVAVSKTRSTNNHVEANEALNITFNKRVKHQAVIRMEPSVETEVTWEDSGLISSLQIKPKDRWQVDTRYEIRVEGVKSIINKEMPNFTHSFETQNAPKIINTEPENNAQNVETDTNLKLVLDAPNIDLISPKAIISPDVIYKNELSEDKKSYTLSFENPLNQSTTYKVEIYDQYIREGDFGRKIYETSFSTVPKLQVSSVVPTGSGVLKESSININFDQPVDKNSINSSFSVSPNIEGDILWNNDKTLTFKPRHNLSLATTYTIQIKSGAKNLNGGVLENDYSSSFTTIGYVTASIYPGWKAGEVPVNTPVKVTFNQAVDHESAQSKFSISPSVSGTFSWSGYAMTYKPSAQSFLTSYTASISAGVKSVYGLDSTQSFSTVYTTETPVRVLNIPFDRQDYALSCEIASLKMALGAKGAYVSEGDLMSKIGYDGPETKTSDNRWGNPHRGFVGRLTGNGTTTGYGVYWGPIATAGSNYRPSVAFSGGNLSTLTTAIDAGNPVVLWGVYGTSYRIDWLDFETGQNIFAVKGEHARVLRGYKGLASDPIGFYIVDPIFGQLYWTKTQLLGDWAWFGNSGVIVY